MTVYDGGGGIVASMGLERQRPTSGPRIGAWEFADMLETLRIDFEAGLMSPREFGEMCRRAAEDRMGL